MRGKESGVLDDGDGLGITPAYAGKSLYFNGHSSDE